jgi:uncharacterized membrane protein YtjA (UPF0391 family)
MLNWIFLFFVLAIIAAIFGFGGIAVQSAYVARVLFFVFLALTLLGFLTTRIGSSNWK